MSVFIFSDKEKKMKLLALTQAFFLCFSVTFLGAMNQNAAAPNKDGVTAAAVATVAGALATEANDIQKALETNAQNTGRTSPVLETKLEDLKKAITNISGEPIDAVSSSSDDSEQNSTKPKTNTPEKELNKRITDLENTTAAVAQLGEKQITDLAKITNQKLAAQAKTDAPKNWVAQQLSNVGQKACRLFHNRRYLEIAILLGINLCLDTNMIPDGYCPDTELQNGLKWAIYGDVAYQLISKR